MVFVSDPAHIGFNPRSTYDELAVRQVSTEIRQRQLPGWPAAESYSEFVALIEVQRRPAFYMWTVLAPVTLIFLISCTIFAVHSENLQGFPAAWNVNSLLPVPRDTLALRSATKQKRNFRSWSTNLSMISPA